MSEVSSTLKKCGISSLYLPKVPNFRDISDFGQRCVLIAHTTKQTPSGSVKHYEVFAGYDSKTGRITILDQGLPALRFPWELVAPRCNGPCLLAGDENSLANVRLRLGITPTHPRLARNILSVGGIMLLLLATTMMTIQLRQKKRMYSVPRK